jgi:hypothetical protein
MGTSISFSRLKFRPLSFLFIDFYRKPDDSLHHKIYYKPTHANFYLNYNSHNNLSKKKKDALSMPVYNAKSVCDRDSVHSELEYLMITFRQKGRSPREMKGPR